MKALRPKLYFIIPETSKILREKPFTQPRPTAARLSYVNLADFFARKSLAGFLHEALLDFLATVSRILCVLSYLNITDLPIFHWRFKGALRARSAAADRADHLPWEMLGLFAAIDYMS